MHIRKSQSSMCRCYDFSLIRKIGIGLLNAEMQKLSHRLQALEDNQTENIVC